jgi:hypothetical protein
VWASGERRTTKTERFELAQPSGRVSVVTIETVLPVGRGLGFYGRGLLPNITRLVRAETWGGGAKHFHVSESFSEPGDVLPITGRSIGTYSTRSIRAKLRARGYVLTRTAEVKRGEYVHTNHVPVDQTPLARMPRRRIRQ